MHEKLLELLHVGIEIEFEARHDNPISIGVLSGFFIQAMKALREAAGIEEMPEKDAEELEMENDDS